HEHWLGTARGRLGWTTPQNVLLYATAGVAVAGVEAIVMQAAGTSAQTNTRWGWTAGAGGEAMLGRGWSAKAEYLYASLQSSSYFPAPRPGLNTRSDVPVDEHLVRFGLNYHFDPVLIGTRPPGPTLSVAHTLADPAGARPTHACNLPSLGI